MGLSALLKTRDDEWSTEYGIKYQEMKKSNTVLCLKMAESVMKSSKIVFIVYSSLTLKNVYDKIILLIPSILGSVSNSGSIQKKTCKDSGAYSYLCRNHQIIFLTEIHKFVILTGMSTCSPGRSRCSSKQKHCILLKYTAACNNKIRLFLGFRIISRCAYY